MRIKVKGTAPVSCLPARCGVRRWSPGGEQVVAGRMWPHHPSGSHVSGRELGVSPWDTGTSLLTLRGKARGAEASGPVVVFLREPLQEPCAAAPCWLWVGGVQRDRALKSLVVRHAGLMSASADSLPSHRSPEAYFHAHGQPTSSTNVSAKTGFVYWTWL